MFSNSPMLSQLAPLPAPLPLCHRSVQRPQLIPQPLPPALQQVKTVQPPQAAPTEHGARVVGRRPASQHHGQTLRQRCPRVGGDAGAAEEADEAARDRLRGRAQGARRHRQQGGAEGSHFSGDW